MLTQEQIAVGKWVRTNRAWPDVPVGSIGCIIQDYGTGVMVEWRWIDHKEVEGVKLRDGFNKEKELQFLEPQETEWVPYLKTEEGAILARVDMRGQKLRTIDDARLWVTQGLSNTHPELRRRRVDCLEEPVWPSAPSDSAPGGEGGLTK